jgi:hypothetical protein
MHRTARGFAIPVLVLALLLALAVLLHAGCGGEDTSGYTEVVQAEWAKLEENSGELVEAAGEIENETDLAGFSDLLAEARDIADSFAEEIGGLMVPAALEDSQQTLEDFLSAYDDYLKALADYLNGVLEGVEPDYAPNLNTLALEAEEALEVYRDGQGYNPAELDHDIWGLPGVLGEAIVSVLGGGKLDARFEKALETLDAWYSYFSLGDGESMYALLDMSSPIMDTFSYQSFLVQVGEANGSGLRADYTIEDAEGSTDQEGDWVTVYLTVDYSEYLDMEGQTVPAHSEDVIVELVNREDGWFVYQVFSESTLW